MDKHTKKMIAPVAVVIAVCAYYFLIALVFIRLVVPFILKIGLVIFSVAVTAVFLAVLIERIKEIKQGEEDDLGKY